MSIKKLIVFLYCGVSLFLLAFVNFDGATQFLPMVVPHIEGKVVIWHFLFSTALVVIYLLFNLKYRLDIPTVCLLLKCIFDAIAFFGVKEGRHFDYFWHYACTLIAFFSYVIISNTRLTEEDIRKLKRLLIYFGVVLSAQVVYAAVFCQYGYMDLLYKGAMVIPYGASNIIAAVIVPIMLILYYSSVENPVKRYSIMAFFIAALVLTKSRGGFFLGVGALLLAIYFENKNPKYTALKRFGLIVAIISIGIALIDNDLFNQLMLGYAVKNMNNITLSTITSSRTTIWAELMTEIFQNGNYLFGVGMKSLTSNVSGAHNLPIDLLYRCGLVGTLNYVVMLWFLIKRGGYLWKQGEKMLFAAWLAIQINSLFEVNYFAYNCDVVTWIIVGLMMNEYYGKRQTERSDP